MNVGDVVKWLHPALDSNELVFGLVIELIDDIEVPKVAKVMWQSGEIGKEWTDELEVVSCKTLKV